MDNRQKKKFLNLIYAKQNKRKLDRQKYLNKLVEDSIKRNDKMRPFSEFLKEIGAL